MCYRGSYKGGYSGEKEILKGYYKGIYYIPYFFFLPMLMLHGCYMTITVVIKGFDKKNVSYITYDILLTWPQC